ncbi:GntR family transcriptional regulator [Paraburkholderia guartelaensis]|uniref:GntR family transcriptional regulator n=1 Tax=Paraburkholderia guartelaensis TaxID=2546446 RepID=UPI001FEA0947|nr:GntR family transcriptional regulator [Paraburkholderia guartelaensis]
MANPRNLAEDMRLSVDQSMCERIQDSLLEMIRERSLKPGDQIPPEPELCELLGVGRSSLREAVAQMISHGLLTRVHGKGTFVRQITLKLQGGLDDLMSVTDMIRSVGAVPSTSRLQVRTIAASGSLAQKLGLAEGDPCVRFERVRRADDAIAAYCIDIVPKALLEGHELGESLFGTLERAGVRLSHTHSSIQPTVLTPRDLPELQESIGMFLLIDEVDFDETGRAVCYSNDYYNASIFKFDLVRKRR